MKLAAIPLLAPAIVSSPSSVSLRTVSSFCQNDNGSNPLVHYTVKIARSAELKVRDHASNIDIRDLAAALDMTTHKGDARIEFAAFSGKSRVDSHAGSVKLTLPRDSGFHLYTDSDKGVITSDFPIMTRSANGHGLSGAVNGGGPALSISTHRGHIQVRAK